MRLLFARQVKGKPQTCVKANNGAEVWKSLRPPFNFALSKIPTSRAKSAREMGPPGFSFPLVSLSPMGTQGRLYGTLVYHSTNCWNTGSARALRCL